MYWLSLVSIPLTLSTLVVAQTPYAANGFLFSNPIQLDGKVCVRAAGGVVAVNSKLEAAACASNNEQKITWSDKSIRIGGLCWSAESGSADVLLKTCNGTDTRQNWTYQKFGQRTVKTSPTGRCLTLLNSNTAPGTPIQVSGCVGGNAAQTWNLYFPLGTQPSKVARDPSQQFGTNQCGTTSSSTANCQNLWINSINDFCLFAPPTMDAVGNAEPRVVSYCMKSGRGSRTFPAGTFSGVHFVKTSSYVQLSGVGNFTKINIPNGDEGGELDPHGATAMGNPIGGIVYGNAHGSNVQYHEWSEFISYREFCIRICLGKDAAKDCPHIYDVMGCFWNQPANYNAGVFETCNGDKTLPAGIYGTSTWFQGVSPTPAGHPAAPSSQCVRQATVSVSPLEPTTGTTTSTSSTTTTTPPTGTARPIKSVKNSAKCLAASGTAAGAKLVIQDCSTSTLQSWRRYGGSGFQNVAAGTCIDVPGGRTTDGNLLQLWTCSAATNMNPNQVFTYNNNGDRHITFKGVSSIDLTDGNTTNGKQMQLWSYSAGNQNQLWTY